MRCLCRMPTLLAAGLVLAVAGAGYAPPPRPRPTPRPEVRPRPEPVPERPAAPCPDAVQVRGEVEGLLKARPAEVFGRLAGAEGEALPAAARAALAREAVGRLAVQVEKGEASGENLALVRGARAAAGEVDAGVRGHLDALVRLAEQRVESDALAGVGRLLGRGQWEEASREAARWLERLHAGEADPRAGAEGLAAEVEQALTAAARLVGQSQVMQALARALAPEGRLEDVDPVLLPRGLRPAVEGLRGLEVLKREAGRAAPNVAQVKAAAAQLEVGLGSLRDGDPTLARQVLQDFALRAFLESRPADFGALWPADGPPAHAAELLRDLKALATGEGAVRTWPAQRSLPAAPGGTPPPGLRPLLPEKVREAWRAPARAAAGNDPSPLEKAAEAAKAFRRLVEADLELGRNALRMGRQEVQEKVEIAALGVARREDGERRRLAAVEEAIQRRLEPAERARARHLLILGQTNAQVARALRPANPDEEGFLQEVEKLVGRPLTAEERTEALRLRKEGRTAAETAVGLRRAAEEKPPPGPDRPGR